MIVKKHINEGRLILAICDDELVGKKFSQKDIQIDLTGSFYKGKELSIEEIKDLTKKAFVINAVGKKSVNFLIKEGFISEKDVINIENIPHSQYYVIS